MEVSEIKENLDKEVYYKLPLSKSPSKYILNAYIFRVDPQNRAKRLRQVELLDCENHNSVIIAKLSSVKTKI